MRPISVLLVLAALAPARAQADEIRGVIAGQPAAFRAGDLAAASGFASPAIRGVSGEP